jgi:hypothetical protein
MRFAEFVCALVVRGNSDREGGFVAVESGWLRSAAPVADLNKPQIGEKIKSIEGELFSETRGGCQARGSLLRFGFRPRATQPDRRAAHDHNQRRA